MVIAPSLRVSTHYDVLGLTPAADSAEIQAAWRRLARVYHPDRNVGDDGATERFQAVVAAYHTLGHVERRRAYDQATGILPGLVSGRAAEGATPRRRGRIPDRAICMDVTYQMNVHGGVLRVSAPGVGRCPVCAGRGRVQGPLCATCNGLGHMAPGSGGSGAANGNGAATCRACQGSGHDVITCERCGGGGYDEPTRVHQVRVESGILDGGSLRIPNAGWPGDDGERGDLLVQLALADTAGMRREGTTVFSEARVRKSVAHLGGTATAPSPDGTHEFRVPPKTAEGTRFEFPGLGLRPGPDAPRGNLVVTITLA
jgi:molecular chaperone DnaJ